MSRSLLVCFSVCLGSTGFDVGLAVPVLALARRRRRSGGRHVHGAMEPLRGPVGHGAQGRGQGLLLPAGPYRAGELPNSSILLRPTFRLHNFASKLPGFLWRLRDQGGVSAPRLLEFRLSWDSGGFLPFRLVLGPAVLQFWASLACRRIKRGILCRPRKFELPRLNSAVIV